MSQHRTDQTPSLAELLENGLAHHRAGRHADAAACYREILAHEPTHPDANQLSGLLAKKAGNFDEAVARMRTSLEQRPDDAEVTYNLGNTHWERGDLETAIACYDRALAIKPDHENAWVNRGRTLQHLGREDEAAESFRRATQVKPTSGKGWENYTLTRRRFAPDDPDLAHMRAALDALDPMSAETRSLHFALARALSSHGARETAFAHYTAGNAIAFARASYDVADDERLFARIRAVFPADRLHRASAGDPDARPIFILGMPRSGTTLVEQILASHSAVDPGGERRDLANVVQQVRVAEQPTLGFPAWIPAIDADDEARIGRAYLDRLPAPGDGTRHVTDKMPANFRLIGLIRRVLPNARIIHVQREPADICLSCFFQNFTNGNMFAFDQTALGRYYRAYHALMAHWRAVMPAKAWLEVRYEDLIAEPETQVERLLSFCGLTWESACLTFHQTDRPVMTASMSQVRQPLYTSAVGRWRAYKPFLGPLFQALGDLAPASEDAAASGVDRERRTGG